MIPALCWLLGLLTGLALAVPVLDAIRTRRVNRMWNQITRDLDIRRAAVFVAHEDERETHDIYVNWN